MVEQKQHKNDKAGQQSGARGFDSKDQTRERDASAASKKTPTTIKNDDANMTSANRQSSARASEKPAGGQEGMRPKSKPQEDEDGARGSSSRNTPASNR